jgi:hypothetical protein
MDERWGWEMIVYWLGTIVAGLILMVVLLAYFSSKPGGDTAGEPIVPYPALLLAGAIWPIGWAVSRAIAGR